MTKHLLTVISFFMLLAAQPVLGQSQEDHSQHHPGGDAPQAQTAPTPAPASPPAAPTPSPSTPAAPSQAGMMQNMMGQMMQRMPENCRAAMQSMPQGCMGMMQQMMQESMGQGNMGGNAAAASPASPSTTAYLASAEKMHGPIIEGLKATDPEVAFVKGMIAHHQGAIDMAKVRLQYGKDAQTKKWAEEIIKTQQTEVKAMQDWLKKNGQ